jgi:hypothetical protein
MTATPPLPSFFLLGAPKCGTSSLHHYLGQHPDVLLSEPKEPRFLEAEYPRGPAWYLERYFAGWEGQPVLGDASPRNLYVPWVPERLASLVPDARLAVVVRNPVDRAYSAWWMERTYGSEPLGFADAVDDNLARIAAGDPFDKSDAEERWRGFLADYDARVLRYRTYVDAGYYADQLERYLARFPREQLLVVQFEDLERDPAAVTRSLWAFMGVDPDAPLTDLEPRKIGLGPAGARLKRLAKRTRFDRIIGGRLRRKLRDVLSRAGDQRPTIDAETRTRLVEHYRPHNERLADFLGRDLAHWSG